jgi:hypothetical protein
MENLKWIISLSVGFLFCLALLAIGIMEYKNASSQNWLTVEGEIIQCYYTLAPDFTPSSDDPRSSEYKEEVNNPNNNIAEIKVKYTVDNKDYFIEDTMTSNISNYDTGKKIPVYYINPEGGTVRSPFGFKWMLAGGIGVTIMITFFILTYIFNGRKMFNFE